MVLSRDQIVERMEKLAKGESLRFSIPETFGGGVAVILLNPAEGKRFLLWVGKDETSAMNSKPYWEQDKAKPIAKWVADRVGDLMG
jgi:hypothetical protein